MALTDQDLLSIQETVTPIAMDIYDKEETARTILPLLAQPVTRRGNGKTVRLEWWAAFPEMREWIDEKSLQKAFRDDMELTIKPYEVSYAFDRLLAGYDDAIISASDLAPKMGAAFGRGKTLLALKPLRDNAVTYDGQNFFDTDHTHPDGTVFSNKLVLARSADATPTLAEVSNEMSRAIELLAKNQLVANEIVSANFAAQNLVVITKHAAVWARYYELLTVDKVGDDSNIHKGKFTLLRDYNPGSTTDYTVDFVQALPGGPRPSIMVVHREVSGVQFGAIDPMKREVPITMDAEYAFGPGFPQCAVRRSQS